MVVAPHRLAAQAGLRVLQDGGNAIEAMVAAYARKQTTKEHCFLQTIDNMRGPRDPSDFFNENTHIDIEDTVSNSKSRKNAE